VKYLPNIPDAEPVENTDNSSDFFSSQEERGLKFKSRWRVIVVVFIALLVGFALFASLGG